MSTENDSSKKTAETRFAVITSTQNVETSLPRRTSTVPRYAETIMSQQNNHAGQTEGNFLIRPDNFGKFRLYLTYKFFDLTGGKWRGCPFSISTTFFSFTLPAISTPYLIFIKPVIVTFLLAGQEGFEPPAPGFGVRCSTN
jgi:hypothetical protein